MYRDEVRLRSLEQRVEDLEAQLLDLERAVRATRPPETPATSAPAAAPPGTQPAAAAIVPNGSAPASAQPMAPPLPPVPPVTPSTSPVPPAASGRRGAIPGWSTAVPAAAVVPRPSGLEFSASPEREIAAGRPASTPYVAAPQPGWRSRVAPEPTAGLSWRDLEERFAGRALAWIGGLALIGAAIFFLSLAFSRGWINEPMRVAIGLVVGGAAFALGGWFLARRNLLMGNVLTAVGLGIVSIALFAATRLYELVLPEVGLAGALMAAAAAAAIAIRYDARIVAAYGLIAALVAPPLVGASPTLVTLAFVAVTLVGTTAIALFRSWRWLPPLAFVLASPQLASWLVGDPDPAQALVALAGFWLVNVVAAAGEEVRVRRDDLRPSSATLVLANAAFLLWGGFVVLAGDLEPWRGTFLALGSLAHLTLGGWFLRRQGLEHLFGNLVGGTGVALLAIATFVQLGAPVVPLAWAAEGVALAWLAVRRRHRWSAVASLALGILAVAHLLMVEYPVEDGGVPAAFTFSDAFLHPEAASMGAFLAAVVVAIMVVPLRRIRSALAGVGVLLAAHAVTFEVTGPALAAALGGLLAVALVVDRLLERLPEDATLGAAVPWLTFSWLSSVAGLVAGAMAVALLFATEYPLGGALGEPAGLARPETLSLAAVLVAMAATGALVGARWVRSALVGLGVLLVAWAMLFDFDGPALIAILAVLLPLAAVADRALHLVRDDPRFAELAAGLPEAEIASFAGALSWLLAAAYAMSTTMSPFDWAAVTPPAVPFSDERAMIAALLAGTALAAAPWLPRPTRRVALLVAVAVGGWVVPFEVYADGVVVLWVALAGAAVMAGRDDPWAELTSLGLAGLLYGGAALVAFAIVASPARLVVADPAVIQRLPLLAGWQLAFAALAAGMYAAARHPLAAPWRPWFEVGSGVIAVYGISVGVVSVFQGATGGALAYEELANQAQVALSVCWTAIGAAALVVGLGRRHPLLRYAGLSLLALATAKVFLVDLASMDVAYRALVLAGLGVLLLVSAWLYTHFRGPRSGAEGMHGGPRPVA